VSDVQILNKLFPEDTTNNQTLADKIVKGTTDKSEEEQMKGAFGMGPLGKVALPARLEDAQILEVQPGIVTSVNVPTQEGPFGIKSNVRYAREGDFERSQETVEKIKLQEQNKYATRINKLKTEAGFKDDKIDISDFTQTSFFGISPAEETETTKVLNSYPGSQQAELAFVDDNDDYLKWLEDTVGKDNFKVFFDKDASFLEPKAYVSIKNPETGEFTPFSSVTKTFGDGLLRFGATLAYEIPTYAANVAVATAVSAPLLAIPVAGIPLATLAFTYTLYAGGKGRERLREYVKEELGINEDADKNLFENMVRLINNALDVTTSPGGGTFREELAGLADAIPGGFYFKRGLKNAAEKAKLKFLERVDAQAKEGEFPSVKPAMRFQEQTQTGGRLDIGKPLDKFLITNLTPNKILERFQNISSQVSVVIPSRIKQQMNSVVEYIQKYKDNAGKGNFEQFRKTLDDLGTYLKDARTKVSEIDMRNLGTSLVELDTMFLTLRKFESDALYKNVFDKTKNSVYNLSTIREALPDIYKAIIPTRQGDEIVPEVPIAGKQENLIRNVVSQIATLGNKDGKLTRQAVVSAINKFKKANPDFAGVNYADVKTPAELLQMYASYFGYLARDVYGSAGTAINLPLAQTAMQFRNIFLDLIAKPDKNIPGLAEALKKANSFYKETFDKTTMETQVALRNAMKGPVKQEPGQFITKIIGSKTGTAPTEFSTITIDNIGFMNDYIQKELRNLTDEKIQALIKRGMSDEQIKSGTSAVANLKTSFNAVIGNKINNITDIKTGRQGTAQEVIDYINSFDDKALEVLGLVKRSPDGSINRDAKNKLIEDTLILQDLASGGFVNITTLSVNTPFGKVIKSYFEDDKMLVTNFEKLLRVARQSKKKPIDVKPVERLKQTAEVNNIRKGLIEYIFSVDSGVFKQIDKNTAFGNAGDFRIDAAKLQEVVEKINGIDVFKQIFSKKDFDILNGLNQYTLTISKGMNDVGASLSGAQIIGGIIDGVTNLEGGKFVKGIARLAGQNRLAKIFVSDKVSNLFTGASLQNIRTNKEKLKEIFLGKQSVAAIISNIALDPSIQGEGDDSAEGQTQLSTRELELLKKITPN